ncbi:uncharacterized protein LOC131235000 [Magnolia sinica]|uniref:uncharacterized protein LOC131235000 n=1 Tax=Magnolia sinica TaxID=86752 RepID=UPI002659403E|nr:uncharacterized protein LOC131235000 [Magnolia sinica]
MAFSISVLVIICSLHLIAFVLAIGAERRRSTGNVVPDEYDEATYCVYDSDASTLYGLAAFFLLLISHALLNGVTRCLCFGRGLTPGGSRASAVCFFIVSWVSFLAAEACLLAGSARNAYHTKYRGRFGVHDLSCAALRKGVFGAAAALTFVSLVGSILYYSSHAKADTAGWLKHQNEGVNMAPYPQPTMDDGGAQKA